MALDCLSCGMQKLPSHPKKEQGMFGRKQPESVEWTIEFTILSEDEIRRIVREEMAEVIPVEVPDAPPEDLA